MMMMMMMMIIVVVVFVVIVIIIVIVVVVVVVVAVVVNHRLYEARHLAGYPEFKVTVMTRPGQARIDPPTPPALEPDSVPLDHGATVGLDI